MQLSRPGLSQWHQLTERLRASATCSALQVSNGADGLCQRNRRTQGSDKHASHTDANKRKGKPLSYDSNAPLPLHYETAATIHAWLVTGYYGYHWRKCQGEIRVLPQPGRSQAAPLDPEPLHHAADALQLESLLADALSLSVS